MLDKKFFEFVANVIKHPTRMAEETSSRSLQEHIHTIAIPALILYAAGTLLTIFTYRFSIIDLLLSAIPMLIISGISIAITAAAFTLTARFFDGTVPFATAIRMILFAIVPSCIISIAGIVPLLGWLVVLAGQIFSLVLLFLAIPFYTNISTKRIPYFIVSFLASAIACIVISIPVFSIFSIGAASSSDFSATPSHQDESMFSPLNTELTEKEIEQNMTQAIANMSKAQQEIDQHFDACIQNKISAKQYQSLQDYVSKALRNVRQMCETQQESQATAFFTKRLVNIHQTNTLANHVRNCVIASHKEKEAIAKKFAQDTYGEASGSLFANMITNQIHEQQEIAPMPSNICFKVDRLSPFHYYGQLH